MNQDSQDLNDTALNDTALSGTASKTEEVAGQEKVIEGKSSRRSFITWLWRIPVIAAIGASIWGTQKAYTVHFDKTEPNEVPNFTPIDAIELVQLGGLELWQQQDFTIGQGPFLLIHTPEAVAGGLSVAGKHYVAFSRLCTHQLCPVQLNSDTEAIAVAFNHRTEHPSLVCHCHLSVFDVMGAGEVVSGPARRALPRVELELRDNTIYAVGLEI